MAHLKWIIGDFGSAFGLIAFGILVPLYQTQGNPR